MSEDTIKKEVDPMQLCGCTHPMREHSGKHAKKKCTWAKVPGMGKCDCLEFRAPTVMVKNGKK